MNRHGASRRPRSPGGRLTRGFHRFVTVARRPTLVLAIVQSVALLAAAEFSLRLGTLPRVAGWFGATLEFSETPPARGPGQLPILPAQRRKLLALARVASHWPLAPNGACLRHSLAAAHLMRRHHPRLRLAVGSKSPRDITAHAWIEIDGIAVTDPGNYLPLLRSRPPDTPDDG